MTPEQMREAAAKIASDRGFHNLARAINDIPLTPPEPTMKDRMAGAVFAHTGYLCNQQTVSEATLEAMREPTEAMVVNVTLGGLTRYQVACIWRTMIDAALAEK